MYNLLGLESSINVGDTYIKKVMRVQSDTDKFGDGRVRITGVSPSGKICEYVVCATNEIFICASIDITDEYNKDTK